MIALSKGETKQLLRSILPLSDGRLFAIMPGAMGAHAPFCAKLISVFHDNFACGTQSQRARIRPRPLWQGQPPTDVLKYILLSLPSPSESPKEMKRDELIKRAFATGTYPTLGVQMARLDVEEASLSEPISYRARLPRED